MGVLAAMTIILLWSVHLIYALSVLEINFYSSWLYIHVLVQAYLYTGLFITAHDSMHRTVSNNKTINRLAGVISAFFYAGMSYQKLLKNHMLHHNSPGSGEDPDFNTQTQNFWLWWFRFLFRYATISQLIIMAVLFNVLKLWVPEAKLWLYWVVPAFLSSLQLFFFGTYLPHKKPHDHEMGIHKARTQNKNHFLAMLSCYFFGYHLEHHNSPHVPWWQLYKMK